MSNVEPWVEEQLEMVAALIPEQVSAKVFTDDRLADALRYLSDDENWTEIET